MRRRNGRGPLTDTWPMRQTTRVIGKNGGPYEGTYDRVRHRGIARDWLSRDAGRRGRGGAWGRRAAYVVGADGAVSAGLRPAGGGGLRGARPRPLRRQDSHHRRGGGGVGRGAGSTGRTVARRHHGRAAVLAPTRRYQPGRRSRRVRLCRVLAGRRLRARYVRPSGR